MLHTAVSQEAVEVDTDIPDEPASVSVDMAAPKDALRTAVLRIGGLTCASCVANVENGASKVDGIVSIAVNLMIGMGSSREFMLR